MARKKKIDLEEKLIQCKGLFIKFPSSEIVQDGKFKGYSKQYLINKKLIGVSDNAK